MNQAVKVALKAAAEKPNKGAIAKAAQGYDPKPAPRTCGNCMHFVVEVALPDWMVRSNADRGHGRFTVELHGIEKNKRCGLGGFAVKKMATCSQFKPKDGA